MPKTKILVCCHKNDICVSESPYLPIHVGKSISPIKLDMQGDNSGENISEKNPYYCELTGIYWAWKNLTDIDIVGLCHYRRYFDFHNQCQKGIPQTEFDTNTLQTLDFSIPNIILEKVKKGSIILPSSLHLPQTLQQAYCESHYSDDFRIMEQAVKDSNLSNASKSFETIVNNGNKLNRYNMFLMRWKDFNDYCQWLFSVLSEVERNTNISNYNNVQKRIYGYMAERLLNVWVHATRKNIIELPIIFVSDNPSPKKNALLWATRDYIWDSLNVINKYSRALSNSK